MARSQLLKDIVSGTVSLESVFLRLKVIMSDFENEHITNWVNGELQGYRESNEVPHYRAFKGTAIGTFIVNNRVQYTNAPVPLESLLDTKDVEEIISLRVHDSIATVQSMLNGDNREKYGKVVPTSFCHSISTYELQIAGIVVKLSSTHLEGIVSAVKSKLVEVIMELEKQFNNLDSLDIKSQVGRKFY
ncbi:hypothetical protein [Brevibacillus fortis]|uniref:AbiTii domain-containing protein n=1 Tax=Brevibacillus fortis TaxID=2126352 RepID=UPI0038FC4F28